MSIFKQIIAWFRPEATVPVCHEETPAQLRRLALETMRKDQERMDAERAARTFSKAQCQVAAKKIAARGEAVYEGQEFRKLFGIDASVVNALHALGYWMSPVPYRGGPGVRVSRI